MIDGELQTAEAADGELITFRTTGDPEAPAVMLGLYHFATELEGAPPGLAELTRRWVDLLSPDFFVIRADYPRGVGRTGGALGTAFTAEIAADDYVRIARAAGVERFGWVGYSWGGAMGVQVACRTLEVSALAIGGFPPLEAPFATMLSFSESVLEQAPEHLAGLDRAYLETPIGFYRSLIGWPERAEVSALSMPRLVFVGDRDSDAGAPLTETVQQTEAELLRLGWEVAYVPDSGHMEGNLPDRAGPVVRSFLLRALKSNKA